jgi:hypothetical protein
LRERSEGGKGEKKSAGEFHRRSAMVHKYTTRKAVLASKAMASR